MSLQELFTLAQRVLGEVQRRTIVVPAVVSSMNMGWPMVVSMPAPKQQQPVPPPPPKVEEEEDSDEYSSEPTCILRIGGVCPADGTSTYSVVRGQIEDIIGSGPRSRSSNIYVSIDTGVAYAYFASGTRTDEAMRLLKKHYRDVRYSNRDGRKRVY